MGIYMYIPLSLLLLGWNTHKPFYFPNAVTKLMTENLYFASLFRSYYKCPQHFSIVVLFCSLLRKGSFKVQYLLNCLISSHNKNYGPDDLSTNWQADHNWPKRKKIQQLFLVLDSFIILSLKLAFSWLGVQKYQPILLADRDSYITTD